MTSNQENKLTMYEAVMEVLNQNKTLWNVYTPIVELHDLIKSKIDLIREYRLTQERDTTGITVDTQATRANLVDATLRMIGALTAHATMSNNNQMLSAVRYSRYDLISCRDNFLVDRVNLIVQIATPIIADLAIWTITPQDLTNLSALNAQFVQSIPAKRAAVSNTKNSTGNIRLTFREIDSLLKNKLDNYFFIFMSSNPDFYNIYKNSRMIIDLGIRHTGAKTATFSGTVINFADESPVSGAIVTLIEKGATFVTSTDGRFTFTLDQPGNYTVKVEKQGFITGIEDPTLITLGDLIDKEVEIEPEE